MVLSRLLYLLRIRRYILSLKFSHFLNFIQIDHKAVLISMVLRDALSTEDSLVVRAVEVLDAVFMLSAELFVHLVVVVEVELYLAEDVVLFDYLVEDVHVERESFDGFEVFDEFVTERTSDSVVLLELG